MAITVKHTKVSTVPDTSDTDLVRPSDWNADHTLTGLGTMAEQNANNVSISGGSISGTTVSGYIPTTEKGAALGVATLDAGGKVPTSQIPLQGDLNYQGTWNASTNTPTLTSSVGTQGYYYVVDVAGSTNLNGITDWQIGDWAIFNGSVWQKVDNTDAVTSVNGLVGTVVLTTTNIAEGTNEYFTTARARTSVSAGTGISYDNSTGVITNSSPSLGGDVVGPASATDNAIARFDTTTGKLIQNSLVTISDTGEVSGLISETFTPITPPTYTEGRVFYDTDAKTLCYYNDNSQMTVNIGQESIIRVRNQTGADIPDGTVVYVNGATGNTPTIAKAIATSFTTADIIGVTTTSIANNAHGYVCSSGLVNGLDTSAFAEGDPVFLSATTAGAFTTTEPTRPNYSVQVGVILRANPSVGTLLVSIQMISTEVSHIVGTVAVNQGGTGQTSYTDGQLLIGNSTGNTLTKTTLTAGTAIGITNGSGSISIANTGVTSAVAGTGISLSGATGAVTVTNTAPDQVVAISAGTGISTSGTYPNFTVTNTAPDQTVVLTAGTGISTSGTYPNFTITNTSPSTGGTVTSVDVSGGTTGLTTSGGPVTGSGTITLAGTLGVANGGTGLTSLTANRVPSGNGTSALGNEADFTYDPSLNTVTASQVQASNGIFVNSATVSANYSIPSGSNAMSAGTINIANGITVTVPSGNAWIIV